jgi:hypothetical protein
MKQARLPRDGIHQQEPADKTGEDRAWTFRRQHSVLQSNRVEPALPVLAEKRKAIALKRANRWFGKHEDPRKAPRHILEMAAETGNYR